MKRIVLTVVAVGVLAVGVAFNTTQTSALQGVHPMCSPSAPDSDPYSCCATIHNGCHGGGKARR